VAPVSASTPGSSRKWVYIGAGIGVVFFTLIILVLALGDDDKKKERERSSPKASTTASGTPMGSAGGSGEPSATAPMRPAARPGVMTPTAAAPRVVPPHPAPAPTSRQTTVPAKPLVKLPAGHFLMGSPSQESGRDSYEGPQTRVTITYGFSMWRTEVTQAEFQAVMGYNPSYFTGCGRDCP
jgi:formylglycine-generating enzyme required for sulfatase activity